MSVKYFSGLLLLILIVSCSSEKLIIKNSISVENLRAEFNGAVKLKTLDFEIPSNTKLVGYKYDNNAKSLELIFNDRLGIIPLRENDVNIFYHAMNSFC